MKVVTSAWVRLTETLAKSVYDNAVITKELRSRMRGKKAFLLMGGYVLFLSAVLLITYYALWVSRQFAASGQASLAGQNLGHRLFTSLTWAQTILLSLVIPALTSGALSVEVEKKTIELLALTRLTAERIVLGKQLSAFLYSLVLLVCSIPLASVCVMFGGISPAEVALAYGLLGAWAFLLTTVGVFWSSLLNRTAVAALLAYGSCGGYTLLTCVLGGLLLTGPYRGSVFALAGLNPGYVPLDALAKGTVCGISIPIVAAAFILHVAVGTLLLLVASTHVKHHAAERALPIRLLLLCITIALTWLILGDHSLPFPTSSSALAGVTASAVAIMLALFTLASLGFATGPINKKAHQSVYSYALSPRAAFRSDMAGAISFTVLWVALVYGTFGTTLLWRSGIGHTPLPVSFWMSYLKIGAVILVTLAALSAMGVLASSIARSKREAIALLVFFIALTFALYGIVLANYHPGKSSPANPVWQLAAFWPITTLIAEIDGWDHNMPTLWWPQTHSWLVNSAVYLAILTAALGTASWVSSRFGRTWDE